MRPPWVEYRGLCIFPRVGGTAGEVFALGFEVLNRDGTRRFGEVQMHQAYPTPEEASAAVVAAAKAHVDAQLSAAGYPAGDVK